MWMHIDSENYAAAKSGSGRKRHAHRPVHLPRQAVSSERRRLAGRHDGSQQAARKDNPLARDFKGGQMARDMTLFVDDDGKAPPNSMLPKKIPPCTSRC